MRSIETIGVMHFLDQLFALLLGELLEIPSCRAAESVTSIG